MHKPRTFVFAATVAAILASQAFAAAPVTITAPNGTQATVDSNGLHDTQIDGANVTLGSKADAATCATTNTAMACFRQLHSDMTGPLPLPAAGAASVLVCSFQIKATATACGTSAAHNLIGWVFDNTANSAISCVQFFNLATGSVTLGTTTPLFATCQPSTTTSAPFQMIYPIPFSVALTVACTTTATGLTSPSSNCNITLLYN